jgi:hypothetical protein
MSGGHFDYEQYKCIIIADEIQYIIDTNKSTEKDEWGDEIGHHLPQDIIEKFKETVRTLRIAEAMAQRVDWLLSGDDGEDCFRKRWEEEVVTRFLYKKKDNRVDHA